MSSSAIGKYYHFCPNCGSTVLDQRLKESLFCSNCLPEVESLNQIESNRPAWLYQKNVKLEKMSYVKDFFQELDQFINFFQKVSKKKIWSLQLSWSKRFLLKYSFSMIAPTWVWKTTWWMVAGAYVLHKGWKVYFILPTSLLATHTYERFVSLIQNSELNLNINLDDILLYSTSLKNKEKQKVKERIAKGDFRALFTTTNFLYKNFPLFENVKWKLDFIFVDDVDSLLKSAKNIDYILYLMGFDEKDIQIGYELMKLKYILVNLSEKNKKYFQILQKINQLQNALEKKKKSIKSILVVSSATAKPRSKKVNLLRELLWFEVWKVTSNLRNVVDLWYEKQANVLYEQFFSIYEKELKKVLNIFGNGILVFVPSDWWKSAVPAVAKKLQEYGFVVSTYDKINDDVIQDFREKKIQILVWIASYRNPLARWIDLPDIAKYAVFLGVPKFVFSPSIQSSPKVVLAIMLSLEKIAQKYDFEAKSEIQQAIYEFVPFLKKVQNYTLDYILSNSEYKEKFEKVQKFLQKILSDKEVVEILQKADEIVFDGKNFIIADVAAYLQASGRVSRMYPGWITKGIALTFLDNKKAFSNLQKKIRWFLDDVEFEKLEIGESVKG